MAIKKPLDLRTGIHRFYDQRFLSAKVQPFSQKTTFFAPVNIYFCVFPPCWLSSLFYVLCQQIVGNINHYNMYNMYLVRKNTEKLFVEWQALQPLPLEYKKKLDEKFRLEFNYNSNHLEGNTLTYGETKLLLIFDQTQGEHTAREYEEMKAHDVAFHLIEQEATDVERPLTGRLIKELNEILLVRPYWKDAETPDGQKTRRQIKVGEYKEYPNSVRLENGEIFEYVSPQETPAMMSELVVWYNDETQKNEFSPLELAALLHYRFIRIHPFDDGNGRTARLLVNYVLIRYGYPPIVIKTDDKKNYLNALHRADVGDLDAFVDYMAKQLEWSLEICIKAAKGENIDEPGDLDKKLTLLKRRLKEDDLLKDRKTLDSLKNLLNNQLQDFNLIFIKEISKFSALFFDTIISYSLSPIIPNYLMNDNEFTGDMEHPFPLDLYLHDNTRTYDTFSQMCVDQNFENIQFLTLDLELRGFRQAGNNFDVQAKVHIFFGDYEYALNLFVEGKEVWNGRIRYYSQLYPEWLIHEDVSIITNKIYEYIQQKVSEGKP